MQCTKWGLAPTPTISTPNTNDNSRNTYPFEPLKQVSLFVLFSFSFPFPFALTYHFSFNVAPICYPWLLLIAVNKWIRKSVIYSALLMPTAHDTTGWHQCINSRKVKEQCFLARTPLTIVSVQCGGDDVSSRSSRDGLLTGVMHYAIQPERPVYDLIVHQSFLWITITVNVHRLTNAIHTSLTECH